jgi:YD repeat-containing protein
MSNRLGLCALLVIFIVGVALVAQTSTNLRYIYDETGRLIGIIDENKAAAYNYDAVGNLIAIEPLPARGPVDIFFVEPNRGVVSTPVTLYGIGFDAMPAQNEVTFNGVRAVVESSTTNSIRTRVPARATTGPIRVTSPRGMAVSRSSFTITIQCVELSSGVLGKVDSAPGPLGTLLGPLAQEKKKRRLFDDEIKPLQAPVTISNGTCSAQVDSFGRSSNYTVGPGCGNVLFETISYVSVNNTAVSVLAAPAWTIVNPIRLTSPSSATSTIRRGTVTIQLDHTMAGPPSCRWVVRATVSSTDPNDAVCWYEYTDYDVIDFRIDRGEWDGVSSFEVRDCPGACRVGFGGISDCPLHFEQRAFPQLRDAIASSPRCVRLSDMPTTLGVCPAGIDWTGAIQFGAALAEPAVITIVRDRRGP